MTKVEQGLWSRITLYNLRNRAAELGYIAHHEKKSNCLVVLGHWHSARRNELDWRR